MAALSSPPHESNLPERVNLSAEATTDATAQVALVNGSAIQHNRVPELPSPPLQNGDHKDEQPNLLLPGQPSDLDLPQSNDHTNGLTSDLAAQDATAITPVSSKHALSTSDRITDSSTQAEMAGGLKAENIRAEELITPDAQASEADPVSDLGGPNPTTSEGAKINGTATHQGTITHLDQASTISEHPENEVIMTEEAAPPESAVPTIEPVQSEEKESSDPPSALQNAGGTAESLIDHEMPDAPLSPTKVSRERDEDGEDGHAAKRAKLNTETPASSFKTPELPLSTAESGTGVSRDSPGPAAWAASTSMDFGTVMTDAQHKRLTDNLRNIRKTKFASAFQKPVDTVLLNLPTYNDIVKQPMDLSTMENKLKERQYESVDAYINDFNLMVENCILFNGKEHVVSTQGINLRAQFLKQMQSVPKAGQAIPEPQKKRKLTVGTREPKRRDSKPATVAASPVVAPPAVAEAFPIGPNGVPTIRRHSSTADGRPKREIHRPPPRDLPYSTIKPRKKKYQTELRFTEHVLAEMKSPKHEHIGFPFQKPVDPVALNIPSYTTIVKKPMSVQTMTEKLQRNEYENANQFHSDFKLIFENCYKFNPAGNPVHELGKKYEALFDKVWSQKSDWIAEHGPSSTPQSPEIESEDEDEDDEPDDRQEALAEINKQIQMLSQQAQALVQAPIKKKTKGAGKKGGKSAKVANTGKGGRKSGGSAGAVSYRHEKKSKLPPKKAKAVTVKQKELISNNIGDLPHEQISKAAELIKAGLRKAGLHELADKAEDDMEFDIDQIPDATLHELLALVKKYSPNMSTRAKVEDDDDDDDEYQSPVKSRGPSKSKKNKPMSKTEQEYNIDTLKEKLDTFKHGNSASPASPDLLMAGGAESSGDDSDSGSESEEE